MFACSANNVQPTSVDRDREEKWSKYLTGDNYFFRITGMALNNTHIIVACKNNQLYKVRFQHDKPDEMGKISYLTQPSQQGSITAIATCLKMRLVYTASSDKTVACW